MSECIVKMKDILVQRGTNKNIVCIEEFVLKQGELVGVIGPNGAGKSTLLQIINLLQPYQGQLQLFGQNPREQDKTVLRRRCAMVFQDTLLLNDTVFNNVALALGFRKLSVRESKERVYKALADFHCEHLAERPALLLSGGEAKRVCIARALVTEPELLLLDEPFSALDVTTRDGMIEEIRKLAEERNITVALVSHDFSEVLHFAKRAVVILEGNIVQDDEPENIMRRPVNVEVARLVGMDNIISCEVGQDYQPPFIRLTPKIGFLYSRKVKEKITTCCIPGDCLYLYEQSLETQRENWIIMEGVVERIIPGVGNYRMLVNVGEQIFSMRVASQLVQGIMQPLAPIRVTFDPNQVHMI